MSELKLSLQPVDLFQHESKLNCSCGWFDPINRDDKIYCGKCDMFLQDANPGPSGPLTGYQPINLADLNKQLFTRLTKPVEQTIIYCNQCHSAKFNPANVEVFLHNNDKVNSINQITPGIIPCGMHWCGGRLYRLSYQTKEDSFNFILSFNIK